jgi:phosphoglycolate phosphatase/pyrophosphatase PpaX
LAIEAVLWDLDGTLISTKQLYIEAYSRALRPYMKRDITEQDVRSVPVMSELRFLRALAADDYDAALADFQRHYAELHHTHFGGIYDGIEETLAQLRQRGLKLGIVTGKSRSSWEVSSATAQLGQFDVIVLDDDVAEPKPHPQGLLIALRELEVEAASAVYIGDSLGDMRAANAAQLTPVLALWSKNEHQRSEFLQRLADEPAHKAYRPTDILSIIGAHE